MERAFQVASSRLRCFRIDWRSIVGVTRLRINVFCCPTTLDGEESVGDGDVLVSDDRVMTTDWTAPSDDVEMTTDGTAVIDTGGCDEITADGAAATDVKMGAEEAAGNFEIATKNVSAEIFTTAQTLIKTA